MKITLTKNVTLPSGKKLKKGTNFGVVNEYGLELIEAGGLVPHLEKRYAKEKKII